MAAMAFGTLPIVVAVGVLLTALAAITDPLCTAVAVAVTALAVLVALSRWGGFDPADPTVQTDQLSATFRRSQAGRPGPRAL